MKIPSANINPTESSYVDFAGIKARATSKYDADKSREKSQQIKPSVSDDKKSADIQNKLLKEDVEKEVNGLNEKLEGMNRSIRFSMDKDSKEIIVTVVDKKSGEVISQIPPEEMIRLKERINEMAGLLLEKTV